MGQHDKIDEFKLDWIFVKKKKKNWIVIDG